MLLIGLFATFFRLRKLVEWAREPHIVTVNKATPLEDWYHVDGPLALVGHAAQPLAVSHFTNGRMRTQANCVIVQAGSVQEAAIAFEDGIALGRIFSHLRRPEQIPTFLEAYEDVRRERDIRAYQKELGDIEFMTLPDEYAELRNSSLRERGKGGRNLFEVDIPDDDDDDDEAISDGWKEWHKIVDQFAYNAEDAADDWWQASGKVIQVSKGGAIDAPLLQILVAQNTKEN